MFADNKFLFDFKVLIFDFVGVKLRFNFLKFDFNFSKTCFCKIALWTYFFVLAFGLSGYKNERHFHQKSVAHFSYFQFVFTDLYKRNQHIKEVCEDTCCQSSESVSQNSL